MKKTIIFIMCFCTLISVFAISCSADAYTGEFNPGDSFTFSKDILFYQVFSEDIFFTSNDTEFENLSVVYRGSMFIEYSNETDAIVVYSEDTGWVNDAYRTITFIDGYTPSVPALAFLRANEAPVDSGFYSVIYNLFKNAIFGSDVPSDFADFSLTLASTIICFGICVLPLIVIFILLKFFLGTIARY